MPDLTIHRLTWRSGLHVGTRGVNLEEAGVGVPSDTLFAALVDAYRRTGGRPDDLIAPFPRADGPADPAPPFLLTSAFPFAGAVRFWPLLAPRQRVCSETLLKARSKEIKRVRFVSDALFRRVLAGENLDAWLFPADDKTEPTTGAALQGGVFWLTVDELDQLPPAMRLARGKRHALPRQKLYDATPVPRVTVDRVSSASEIFHAGRVTFAPGCGLWFGVAWLRPQDPVGSTGLTYRDALTQALGLLADDGLGGERSTGYGAFAHKEEEDPLSLPDPAPGGLALLLSRYHPRPTELPAALTGDQAAYDLVPVGGWLRSWDGAAQRRKRLWLVAEGSVVRAVGAGPWGDLVDVRPAYGSPAGDLPHPVWRYGLALGAALQEVYHG